MITTIGRSCITRVRNAQVVTGGGPLVVIMQELLVSGFTLGWGGLDWTIMSYNPLCT